MDIEDLGFWKWAAREPERIALIDPTERRVSYGELLRSSNRVAHALRDLGLEKNDSVAVLMPNNVEFFEILFGCLQIGVYFTPINTYLAPAEAAHVLLDSESKLLFFHEQHGSKAAAVLDHAPSFAHGRSIAVDRYEGFRRYRDFEGSYPEELPDDRVAGQTMIYTSGTTGKPKGVRSPLLDQSPEEGALARLSIGELIGWVPDEGVYLLNGPLHHSAPVGFSTLALQLGHAVVMTDKWDAETVLQRIEKYRVTNTQMVPIHFHRLLKLPEATRKTYDVSSVESILHSAAPCPVDVKRSIIEWFGPIVYEYYGGTEGGMSHCNATEWLSKPGTVGKPWPGVEIRILDEEERPLGPGEIGTVYAKTPTGAPTYFKDAKKSESVRRGDFFTLGDVGYLDDDGWLFLVDRRTDMLVSGGVNIYPAEIEAVLMMHPKVRDAAVIGIPNEEWGEEPRAFLELEAGVRAVEEAKGEILEFCRGHLAGYKIPKSVQIVEELPRGPNGKLYKRQLKEEYGRPIGQGNSVPSTP